MTVTTSTMQEYTAQLFEKMTLERERVDRSDRRVVTHDGVGVAVHQSAWAPNPLLYPAQARDTLLANHPVLRRVTDWTNVVAAGGSVARALTRAGYDEPRGDVDLFFHGIRDHAHLESVVRRIIADIQPAWVYRGAAVITMGMDGGGICQLIMMLASGVEGVVEAFDIDESCAVYDGTSISLHPRAVEAYSTRLSRIRPPLANTNFFWRLLKYAKFTSHRIVLPHDAVKKIDDVPVGAVVPLLKVGGSTLSVQKKHYGTIFTGHHRARRGGGLYYGGDPDISGDIVRELLESGLPDAISLAVFHMVETTDIAGFMWDEASSVGKHIRLLLDSPEKVVPKMPLATKTQERVMKSSLPYAVRLSIIRNNDVSVYVDFVRRDVAGKLEVMRDTFWTRPCPLALQPMRSLFFE